MTLKMINMLLNSGIIAVLSSVSLCISSALCDSAGLLIAFFDLRRVFFMISC